MSGLVLYFGAPDAKIPSAAGWLVEVQRLAGSCKRPPPLPLTLPLLVCLNSAAASTLNTEYVIMPSLSVLGPSHALINPPHSPRPSDLKLPIIISIWCITCIWFHIQPHLWYHLQWPPPPTELNHYQSPHTYITYNQEHNHMSSPSHSTVLTTSPPSPPYHLPSSAPHLPSPPPAQSTT